MIRLGVLGEVTLRRSHGPALNHALAQPKRVALLVYLATKPGEFHRRDTLLPLFWPELDERHARAALSQGLLFLRRELGDSRHEVLRSRGNDEIAVDADHLWCDAVEFRECVRGGRYVDALTLYRGDFLQGFHAGCGHEFEEWSDQWRQALLREAADAAAKASVAAERAGDSSSAIAFSRQALELAGYDERSTRQLIELLDRTGDQAAALKAYDELVRRLAADFDAVPARETASLVKDIQQRRMAGAMNAAVLPPRVASSTSPRLAPNRSKPRRIATAVRVVTLGIVLALTIRQRRANPPSVSSSVLASTTPGPHRPSPAAYQSFLKGHYEFERWPTRGASEAALRYYTAAVTQDPQYALAYAEIAELVLGTMSVTSQDVRTGEAAASRAIALDSNLADAHVAQGLAHFRAWKWAPAEREFRRAITMNSNLPAAHRFYSQLLRITRRPDEAIREARTAEALEPLSLAAKADLAAALFDAHRFDDAIETWKDVLELDPTYTLAAYSLGLGFGIEGRTAELNATAQRAMKLAVGGEYELNATFLFAVEYAELGRRRQADSVVAVMQSRFPGAARLPGLVAIVMVRENRLDDAMEWLELGFQQRDFAIANATCEPWFDPLRKDPRFRHLRAKLGLPD